MRERRSKATIGARAVLCVLLFMFCVSFTAGAKEPTGELEKGFQDPPVEARMRGYWWWLRANVTKEAITCDLEEMKEKGYGGVMITDAGKPAGPVPEGPVFASPEWLDFFRHALDEADRLGLKMGVNMQSGWNLGGPGVKPEESMKELVWNEVKADGPGQFQKSLPVPDHRADFYRDVAVLAYRLPSSSGEGLRAEVSASSSQSDYPPAKAADGQPETFWASGGLDPDDPISDDNPQFIQVRFEKPFSLTRLRVKGRPGYGPRRCQLQVRKNGEEFRAVKDVHLQDGQQKSVRFDKIQGSVFRLFITDAYDRRFPDSPRNVQIQELVLMGPGGKWPRSTRRPIKRWREKAIHSLFGTFSAPETAPLLDNYTSRPGEADLQKENLRNLTEKMAEDGSLEWTMPEGRWNILRIGFTITGAHTKTHGPGWRGLCVDYLEEDALRSYWSRVVEKLLDAAGPHVGDALRFLHTDSWEMGAVNWTEGFAEQFRKRRGYSPAPYLPVLAGKIVDSREVSNRFLFDFRRTVGDCIAENHYGTFAGLAEEEGLRIHPESGGPHAAPIDALQCLGRNHLPMGEFWARAKTHRVKPRQRLFMKQSASAAHIYGKKRAAAEGFTTIGPHWERDPWMLKPTFDREACEGMNLLYWHTFTCSPAQMGVPGQEYFAGTHLNPNVTWWDQAGAFVSYINRCQYLLQRGHFVADVVYYYGDLVPNFVRHKETDPAGVLPGYDYDITNTEALMERMEVQDGQIVLPNGITYRVLVLPDRKAMRLRVLRKVARLVKGGVTVVGPKPERTPGLRNYPKGDKKLRNLADQLWGTEPHPAVNTYGKGQVIRGKTGREALQGIGVPPDFSYETGSQEAKLDYIHRRAREADIYFVVNRRNRRTEAECVFRTAAGPPELWNPVTGEMRPLPEFRRENGRTGVPLRFAPYQSYFLVFREEPVDHLSTREKNFPQPETVARLKGPWTVNFDPDWGGPEEVIFEKLTDWTNRPENGIKYYSGTAIYHKEFDLPAETSGRLWLHLGTVKNLAEVRLNGHDLGVVWAAPWRVEISDAVKPTDNTLEIDVVNLWPNRLIGDGRLPEEERYTETHVDKFYKGEHELLESGLLGPVTIKTEKDE